MVEGDSELWPVQRRLMYESVVVPLLPGPGKVMHVARKVGLWPRRSGGWVIGDVGVRGRSRGKKRKGVV